MRKTLWEVSYANLFSFNKKEDRWDDDIKNVVAAGAEQAIEKVKRAVLKESGTLEDENGKPGKRWTMAGFRLTGIKELNSIDIS